MENQITAKNPASVELPERINRLTELAYNLWWAWNPEAIALYKALNRNLWDRVSHNPIAMLQQTPKQVLEEAAANQEYLNNYDKVMSTFDAYMSNENTWWKREYPGNDGSIAYLSFEFGLHESIPAYAGGLGILAGDHLKEASDMGLPLSAVGFIYNQGYFTQKISEDGWQETSNFYLDFTKMPIIPLLDANGEPVCISIDLPGRQIKARVWMIRVGRVSLYLLDTTTVESNSQYDRQLTSKLYTADLETRISQEILLGIGGVRVMRVLGKNPTVWHMNEGHAAFLSLERCRELVDQGKDFEEALEIVRKNNVFTTHTPVPAGNDRFPIWLMEKYFGSYWNELGLTRDEFINLGKEMTEWGEQFTMPVLALTLSEHCNGVSKLHGAVSREMWHFLWPEKSVDDVPIDSVTNGVHSFSWLSRRMGVLFDDYMGKDWRDNMDDAAMWEKIEDIPDDELWTIRRHQKRMLMNYITRAARTTWLTGTVHPVQTIAAGVLIDPDALTIGFARRFPTYKRGNLILRDWNRLLNILNNVDRPVQFIFSGKAHPSDEPGKLILQQLYRAIKDHRTGGRMVFLEDYNMDIARHLVQGVDVWMNTPRRPQEASGTSGMKAAMNGCLNFSVLDGWWAEGYNGLNGWAIGTEQTYTSTDAQDDADSRSLYETLENEIIPLYYDRQDVAQPSVGWVKMMKNAIRTLSPMYCTRRMVSEYVRKLYFPK